MFRLEEPYDTTTSVSYRWAMHHYKGFITLCPCPTRPVTDLSIFTGSLVGYGQTTLLYLRQVKLDCEGLLPVFSWSGCREVRFRSRFLPWTWRAEQQNGHGHFQILLVGNLLSATIMRRRRWPAESLARSPASAVFRMISPTTQV